MPTNTPAPNNQKPMTWNEVIRQLYPPSKPHNYHLFIKRTLVFIFSSLDLEATVEQTKQWIDYLSNQFDDKSTMPKIISDDALDCLSDFVFKRLCDDNEYIYNIEAVKKLLVSYTEQDHHTGEVLIEAYTLKYGCEFFKERSQLEHFVKTHYSSEFEAEIVFIKTLQRDC